MSQATFGGFIGFAKFKSAAVKILLIPSGFLFAVFLHFAWNLTVSFEETTLLGIFFLILYFFSIFAVFQISLYLEGKTIRRELYEEAHLGLIPVNHVDYIPYVFRRYKYGWCPNTINQKEYVKSTIILALRKNQYKNSKGSSKINYQKEVQDLRYKIQMMFYNAKFYQYSNYH